MALYMLPVDNKAYKKIKKNTLMHMRVIDIPYVTLRMRGKHIRDVDT